MFTLKKADLLSTLFVGIDISSRENVVAVMDFESTKPNLLLFQIMSQVPKKWLRKYQHLSLLKAGLKNL